MSSHPPREGSKVSYVGDEFNGDRLSVGDEGRVLSHGGSACHVIWASGEREGQVTLTANCNLLSTQPEAVFAREGHLVSMALRDIFEKRGNRGLLGVLAEEGALASLTPAADEALAFVMGRVRGDAGVQEVLAHLDEDEADEFVSYAALALLREAFGSE